MKNILCKIFGHKYCPCGWCIKHPICRRCYWDRNCRRFHSSLSKGIKCQHVTHDLLKSQGDVKN